MLLEKNAGKSLVGILKLVFLLVMGLLLFTACSIGEISDKEISESFLAAGLNVLNESNNGFLGESLSMDVKEFTIEKRQTNDKNDIVYCCAKLDHVDYSATVYYRLVYNYYDKGGWILDEYSQSSDYSLSSKSGVQEQHVIDFLYSLAEYNGTLSYQGQTRTDNESIASVDYEVVTTTADVAGNIQFTFAFDQSNGIWQPTSTYEKSVTAVQYQPEAQWILKVNSKYIRLGLYSFNSETSTAIIRYKEASSIDEAKRGSFEQYHNASFNEEDFVVTFDPFYVANMNVNIILQIMPFELMCLIDDEHYSWATYYAPLEAMDEVAIQMVDSSNAYRVFDNAQLFDEADEKVIESIVAGAKAQSGMDIVILTCQSLGDMMIREYADKFYDLNNFGTDEQNSGYVFLINMEKNEFFISTTGRMIDVLSDERMSETLSLCSNKLRTGDYSSAIIEIIRHINQYQ